MDEKIALGLLRKYAPDDRVYKLVADHSKAVQKAALMSIKKFKIKCNVKFVRIASLLHDIGRFKCPPQDKEKSIRHGFVGGKILKKEGLPRKYQRVCETHIGIGITKNDVIEQKLPLPEKDYVPKTREEVVIAYADNLATGDKIQDESFVAERYKKELGEKFGKRVELFHKKVHEFGKK